MIEVARGVDGWVLLEADKPPITVCACCDRPFSTRHAAEVVASFIRAGVITSDEARGTIAPAKMRWLIAEFVAASSRPN